MSSVESRWEPMRARVRSGEATVAHGYSCIPGLQCISCTMPDFGIPIGFVWYREAEGKRLSIGYIWVREELRRCGLATSMLNYLLPIIEPYEVTTGRGNELSEPWLRSNGFVRDEERWVWIRKTHKEVAA